MSRVSRVKKHHTRTLAVEAVETSQSRLVMFLCRESSAHNYGLMDDLIGKVLIPHLDRYPELEPIVAHGADFLRHGPEYDRLREAYGVEKLYGGVGGRANRRPVAYAIQRGNGRVILALSSAGSVENTGEASNAWTSVLAQQVNEFRPSNLFTGAFSRIIRNQDVASRVKLALEGARTRLHCFEFTNGFELTDPMGQMMWNLLAQAAHSDWVATLTRLQMGRVFALSQNEFPAAELYAPVGYRKVEQGKKARLEPDLAKRAIVRTIIELAASDADVDECMERLQKVGLTRRSQQTRGLGLESVSDRRKFLETLWGNLEVYREGKYETLLKNSVPGCDSMLGQPVHRDGPDHPGEFHFVLDLGVPEGGWHDADLVDLAIQTRLEGEARRSTRAKDTKPLLGLGNYIHAGREYRLLADDDCYVLRSRPEETIRKSFGHYEGTLEARIRTNELHQAVSEGVRSLARFAATNEELKRSVDPVAVETLKSEQQRLSTQAAAARELAATHLERDPEQSHRYAEDAAQFARQERAIQTELDHLLKESRLVVGSSVQVEQERLVAAAELLARTKNLGTPEVVDAVRSVVHSVRVEADPTRRTARIQLRARARVAQQTIILGPTVVTTRNRAARALTAGPDLGKDRNLSYLHEWLIAPTEAAREAVRRRQQFTPAMCSRRRVEAASALFANRRMGRVILDAPIPDLHAVLLNPQFEQRGLAPIPITTDLPVTWLREMPRIYRDDSFTWLHESWARCEPTRQRQLLTWLEDYNDDETGLSFNRARTAFALSDPDMYALLDEDPGKYVTQRTGTWAPLEWAQHWGSGVRPPAGKERTIRLRPCPHCGSRNAGQLLKVPEVPSGWICGRCRRSPGSPIVFPDAYLQPWCGSQAGSKKVKQGEDDEPKKKAGTRLVEVVPLSCRDVVQARHQK